MVMLARTSGIGLSIAAIAALSGVDAIAKSLGADFSSFQVVFMRYIIAAVFLAVFILLFVRQWPKSGHLKSHALRGFLAASTASLFFYGLAGMPLFMALSLGMTAPLYIALLGRLVFKERMTGAGIKSILLAAIGSCIIVFSRSIGQVGPPISFLAIVAGLLAPIAYAFTTIAMKKTSEHDNPVALSLMQTVFAALFSLPLAALFWKNTEIAYAWQIGLIGFCGAIGFILLIAALNRIPASLYAVMDYSALVWAGLFGFIFFAEIPTMPTLFGAALIIVACLISAHAQRSER